MTMAEALISRTCKRRMDGAIAAFKHDFASLRTGRASSNLLDPVQVQAYGSTMPINQVATVTVPEPRMISVSVWDKSMVGAVDRAIREANLGFNPIVDGTNSAHPAPRAQRAAPQGTGQDRASTMPRTRGSPSGTCAATAWTI